MSSAQVHVEPPRFGMTGFGVGLHAIRWEFCNDALAYSIDAPAFVPRGSVQARKSDDGSTVYVSHTGSRA